MTYDYFIASRWRNKEQVLELSALIKEKGKTVYCFAEGNKSEFVLKNDEGMQPDEFMQKFESIPDWQNDPNVWEVFDVDMNALKAADCVLLLLPAGKSAHIEAGVAYGLGKKLVVIGEQKESESLYLIFDEFYADIISFIESLS